jgi:hypothetical protein
MVNYGHPESDDVAAEIHGGQRVLMLALRIAIVWTALSLLCAALWVLFLETGRFFESAKAGKIRRRTAVGLTHIRA